MNPVFRNQAEGKDSFGSYVYKTDSFSFTLSFSLETAEKDVCFLVFMRAHSPLHHVLEEHGISLICTVVFWGRSSFWGGPAGFSGSGCDGHVFPVAW